MTRELHMKVEGEKEFLLTGLFPKGVSKGVMKSNDRTRDAPSKRLYQNRAV